MQSPTTNIRRIECNFAACEATQLVSYCAFTAFVAVYLSHKGLDNTQIGLASSLTSGLAILMELVLSSLMDKHPEFPIKYTISLLLLLGAVMSFCLYFFNLPVWMMLIAFCLSTATGQSNCSFLNAQLVQFNNVGIPARFGWPRGVGSFSFAVAAYVYGIIAANYSADLLPLCHCAGSLVCIVCVLLMPNPYAGRDLTAIKKPAGKTSYRAMFTGNTALVVLLFCVMLNSIGNNAGYVFTLRVVQKVGGGAAEYGVSEFLRAASELPILVLSTFLLRRYKKKALLAASYLFTGIRSILLALAPSIAWVYAVSLLNMLSTGLNLFAGVLFVNTIVRENEKVRGQALVALCGSIGSIIGTAYAGAMIDAVGLEAMLYVSSAFCLLGCVLLMTLCRPERQGLAD